jgi:hypothetical protein
MGWAKRAAHLCIAVFVLSSTAWADPVCKLPRLAHADLAAQPDGTLLLPVSVNGQTEYFRLGGGAHSFVYEADADTLDFGHHHYERDDGLYFGQDEVKLRRTADLIIGRVRWRKLEFYPIHKDRPAGQVAIGSLGMNFLAASQLDVEINTSARAVNFIQPGSCPRPPWDLDDEGTPTAPLNDATTLPVMLNGHRFSAIFDISSPMSSLDGDAFRRIFDRSAEAGLVRELDTLAIDRTAIQHPVFRVIDDENKEDRAYVESRARALNPRATYRPVVRSASAHGVIWLGLPELDRMRIYFMFAQHKVFVTPVPNAPNTGVAPPMPAPDPDEAEQQSH